MDATVMGSKPGDLRAEVREQAVALAIRLCEQAARDQKQIPERSQLNTLVRAAQGTPSVKEAILFVRYQAARQGAQQGAFLAGVADALEAASWSQDIGAVRFFLGSLARAGYVTRERARRRRGTQGGRDRG